MSFIGNVPAESYTTVVKDTFSGNDSTTDFTLSIPATTNSVNVYVENVAQEPTDAYTISGTTLSFTAAPVSGTDNIYVIHRGPAVQQVVPPAGVAIDASSITASGNLSVTGTSTLTGNVTASGDVSIADKIIHTGDTNTAIRFPAADTVTVETGGSERARIDSSGNLQFNSGFGSVATAYGCRAWVNFNGQGTVAIREDGNVSSITDNSTGNYTVNFATAMPDANYCVNATDDFFGVINHSTTFNTTSVGVVSRNISGTATDNQTISVAIFR